MIPRDKTQQRDKILEDIVALAPGLQQFFGAGSLADGCRTVLDQCIVPDGGPRDAVLLVQEAAGIHHRISQTLGFEAPFCASLAICLAARSSPYEHVLIRRSRLQEMEAELIIDELTGLYNRRHINMALHKEFERFTRSGRSFSILIADVDRFKRYNDRYGHGAGDTALKQVAHILRSGCRGVDKVARYGGEEFLLLLPDTDQDQAVVVAERIRRLVAWSPFPNSHMQVSIGLASAAQGCVLDELLLAADKALYRAKKLGRNRVCISSADNRGAARIPVRLPVRLQSKNNGAALVPGEMINISSGGALVFVEDELPQEFAVQLVVTHENNTQTQDATIIRSERWNGNCKKFRVGLQFASETTAESRLDMFINERILKLHQPQQDVWRPQ